MEFDIQKTTAIYNQVNQKLGTLAPFFWSVFSSFVAQGTPTTSAIEKSFQVVQDLPKDAHSTVFNHYLGLKVAA